MLFRHIGNKKYYKFIGTARSVENPSETMIIYKQLYKSKLRLNNDVNNNDVNNVESGIILPYGSMWIRKESDFRVKFSRIWI